MKSKILLKWFWLNFQFFVVFFLLVWGLIILFPDRMLGIFGQWALLLKMAGAQRVNEFGSLSDVFNHILTRNGMTVILYFIIGWFLQSPLVMLFTGAFYAFIVFLAPVTIGKSLALNDWLVVSGELFTLILSISVSSAVAGDVYGVDPDARSLWGYWKHHWRAFWPRPVNEWRLVLGEWTRVLVLTGGIIVGLSVLVAWFETYGY